MKIVISNDSNVPIYEQIKYSIKNQILSSNLISGEMLPSIRSLAYDIKISVMTIKKAYDELEREGFIVTKQGKGSYVSLKNTELIREERIREIENYYDKIIGIANSTGISKSELMDLFNYLYEEEKK